MRKKQVVLAFLSRFDYQTIIEEIREHCYRLIDPKMTNPKSFSDLTLKDIVLHKYVYSVIYKIERKLGF